MNTARAIQRDTPRIYICSRYTLRKLSSIVGLVGIPGRGARVWYWIEKTGEKNN